ncbi:hypothetical protein Hdeb2414_s0007g00240961 [Helianthus debilis subsp. tardiflorus]
MGKSKKLPGKGKVGKGAATSSRSNKRPRTESGSRQPQGPCPDWPKNKKLLNFPEMWREQLYRNKVVELKHERNLIVAEKTGSESDFKHYGVVECFERLGWLNAFTLEKFNQKQIYLDEIITWMATLRKVLGKKPPTTTKLIGTVGETENELSFNALDKIADFDSGATNPKRPYEYLSTEVIACNDDKYKGDMWVEMLCELFDVPPSRLSIKMTLDRCDLRQFPKLLSSLTCCNILPRTSDISQIRNCDVRVLHALCTGFPTMSFKQMVLHNIWEARISGDRKTIPHFKLITALLVNVGVITETSKSYKPGVTPFTRDHIRDTEFIFIKSKFAYILEDYKGKLTYEVPREDQGEEEEDDEAETENDEDVEEREYDRLERGGDVEMQVERPPTWGNWTSYEREMYVQQAKEIAAAAKCRVAQENSLKTWQEEQAKLAQERWEKQEAYEKS